MVLVYKVRMSDGVPARTDGVNIWVDDRLDDIGVRCAVAHEMIHIERGHSTLQNEDVELQVRYETAMRLLPLSKMVGICSEGSDLKATARELGVTRQVLMDRAATLTRTQSQTAKCFSCLKCPVQQARMDSAINELTDYPRLLRQVAVAA